MAAKLSDLADEMSGTNLHMEGHVDVLAQSAKDLWEQEALDSPLLLTILLSSLETAIQSP